MPQIILENGPEQAVMGAVVGGLTAYNASQSNGDTPNYLVVSLRDDDGTVLGGLIGATYLGWLQVQAVWVSDALRGSGSGSGTALMRAAEEEAVRRGCPRVFLETLSFQALPFYEKLGYRVHSSLPDFPPGGCRYALTKQLG
ncbi:GNAT family N-acetyltransferase [Duganella sp. FT80W]|uniref:GNAT family N-acetyltransferase n=1 Tax=Duganella guangzhouensis TaxID=2666084 RepID=A0A6I2KTT9_9BURK|nr:GNAT family N-acetyltransferase [Duganella guangzhouensis]MRW88457.1 GNAT family N-acetyltransferase [Duganella guangzhouensis]